ncbi:9039_t:CDS:10 [Ambispora leptoticha]|uniref:Nucleolar complex-associated protein 3 n=1 Tax=Ambispora leptoticha TaxID=144679 RepID=A0A9N9A8C6_9GLOM|nr:9039_t:CDS:10 [Ambispora leptoticha]
MSKFEVLQDLTDDIDEQSYEREPRKPDNSWRVQNASARLPIKLPNEKHVDPKAYYTSKKEELANVAQSIIEDPEQNVGQLRKLREVSKDSNVIVKKFAFLTQLAVYKDIIPGYRIRVLTEKEKSVKVSKEVKKLRYFEQNLLANYKAYLQSLQDAVKATEKRPNKKGTSAAQEDQDDIGKIALQCMCTLLTSATHFNFRLNLMNAIIARMSTRKFTDMLAMCCDAIIEVYKNDESGEASLDAVKITTRMIKAQKYKVHELVINTFLHLRLRDELVSNNAASSSSDQQQPSMKKRKKEHQHISRKMRKLEKDRKVVEKEMKEAEAVVDREDKEKKQTETLKLVFATYFRILKHSNDSPLLSPVLEGLAKFAHLINDGGHLDDNEVIDSRRVTTRRSLLCVITAFQLLSGQEQELLMKGFEFMFFKRRQIPIDRSAAFLKRLSIACLNWSSKAVLECLNRMEKMIQKHPRLDALLTTEDRLTNGVYRAELDDPELCNPFATNLWELCLLEHHYDPKVRQAASHLANFEHPAVANGRRESKSSA